METMSKFKVGDKIVRISAKASWAPLGYIAEVLEGYYYFGKDDIEKRLFDHQWELVQEDIKPKWTIYNNDKAWQDLSDKQKGKLLLASHAKIRFTCNKIDVYGDVAFNNEGVIYKAQYIEPVKLELTMEEVFESDWYDCSQITGDCAGQMIAKGWNKP
jgi:hypothetical protein